MKYTTKIFLLFAVAIALIVNSGCAKISPGHVGVIVNQWGSDKGVSSFPAVTGVKLYNPVSTTIFEYPTYVQTAKWTQKTDEGSPKNEEICFSTKDQVQLCADMSLSYHLNATQVPHFYVQFRSDDLNTFTHGFLYNTARGSFGDVGPKYTVEEAMTLKRVEMIKDALSLVNAKVNEYGVVIDQFDFIGQPRPPANIVNSINAKVQATQDAIRVENELRAIKAEAAKAVAKADGEAEANNKITKSLTPQLIQWKQLELQNYAIGKWNGTLPTMMTGNSAVPFINLK